MAEILETGKYADGAPPELMNIYKKTVLGNDLAGNLKKLIEAAGISPADLARHLWGTYKQPDGHIGAKSRDRISRWMKGDRPRANMLNNLSLYFGIPPETLGPDVVAANSSDAGAPFSMALLPSDPTKAHLQVDVVVDATLAMAVTQKLIEGLGES